MMIMVPKGLVLLWVLDVHLWVFTGGQVVNFTFLARECDGESFTFGDGRGVRRVISVH